MPEGGGGVAHPLSVFPYLQKATQIPGPRAPCSQGDTLLSLKSATCMMCLAPVSCQFLVSVQIRCG